MTRSKSSEEDSDSSLSDVPDAGETDPEIGAGISFRPSMTVAGLSRRTSGTSVWIGLMFPGLLRILSG
jgi:hypothetical protein